MGTKKSTARVVLAIVLSIQLGTGLQAQRPDGGVVVGGSAQITTSGTLTRIDQTSDRAIINWTSFGIGAAEQVLFLQPSARSATLNRVTGAQASVILGRLDANGQVLLINPNGIVFGGGAQINVGGMIASTSNMSNANFMTGRLVFDQPGRPGAGILNAGAMTAAEGGLIALVAPHVRNDGVIVARLGKVILGAADTFTVDLYGDGLIDLALSGVHAGQLHTLDGAPVTSLITQAGTIDTAGGKTVLMTASNAKSVLDNLINMSGTIKADAAVEQGGRILLLGEGGQVNVSGSMSAQGATGGSIDVLGGQVHLASTAALDASGANGGGAIHVGGAFQGGGDTYRSTTTTVDAGATLTANALDRGNGGEVVVWSDGRTEFSGAVQAKGGANGGNGGRMEVSGKGTLDFLGQADASAVAGQAGSLLLDPTNYDIGATEAAVLTRVLRTGTSTTLAASNDISVNSAITGGDRIAGGGLTMTAGNNINVNDFIVTNNGAVNLFATQGTVSIASGKAIFAGNAPISVTAGGSLHTGALFTGGALAISSTGGSVTVDSFIDGHAGTVNIHAAGNVDINQPIVNLAAGDGLDVTAGNDVNVNAPVDGRGGVAGGAVTMTAANNLHVNDSIVTNNGAVNLAATNGTLNVAQDKVLVAGTGAIALSAHGDVTTGGTSAGAFTIASSAGSVNVNGLIDGATGATRIAAGTDVNINQSILNGQSGSGLTVGAGRDVNVNALIDGLGGVAGGAVALTAGRNLNLNESVATNNGAVNLIATGGTETAAANKVLFAGSAPIVMRSGGDLTTGATSGGSLSATSTGGSVNVNGVIDGSTGRVDLSAANNVLINAPVLSPASGNPLAVAAGGDISVNAQIDGRGGATGGSVTLTAGHNVAVNNAVITNNGAIGITATGGAATVATGAALVSGNGAIAMTAGGDVTTSGISGGSLTARSTGGSVNINGVIDGTGGVDLTAAGNVNINQAVNTGAGAAFNATAGGNVNVNAPIATNNGAINLFAANGTTSVLTGGGLFAGLGAISLNSFGNITTGLLTGGPMSFVSRGGSVTIGGTLVGSGGAITIGAAGEVDVNQGIFFPGTAPITITAGTNINVNAEIDGRSATGPLVGGAATLTAGQNVVINKNIDTQNAGLSVTATNGVVTMAANQGLFAGSGSIGVQSGQTLTQGITSTTGAVNLRSTGGSVNVDTGISAETGAVTITAATDVNVNQIINNNRADAPLSVTAGHDINVNAAIDGRDALPGSSGTITMTAGNNVNVNQTIATKNAAIGLTATSGALTSATGVGRLFAGTGPVTLKSTGDLSTGSVTAGFLTATSTAGTLTVNGAIAGGKATLNAGQDVQVSQAILSPSSGLPLTVTAGRDVLVNAQIDGRNGATGGAVALSASRDVDINNAVITNNGAINVTAARAATMTPGATLASGTGAITMTAGADVTTGGINGGSFSASSTGGAVNVNGVIANTTGRVDLTAATDVNVNQAVTNLTSGAAFNATAGNNINVNAQIDGSAAAGTSGAATLIAANDLNVNAAVLTRNAAITAIALNGAATIAPTAGLFAGTGAISLNALGNVSTGALSGGAMNVFSLSGSVTVNGKVAGTGGAMTFGAATSVDVAQTIANTGTTSPLTITAGTDINVNGQIDGRTALNAPSSTVTLTAGQNVNVNKSVNTTDAAINVTATNGTVATGVAGGLFAGAGAISVQSGATLNTGTVDTTGALSFRSTNGSVNVATQISGDTGTETIQAAQNVNVNQAISNKRTGSALTIAAGANINVNANIDGRDAVLTGSSGTVGLTAGNNIAVNQNIVTRDSAIALTATNGTITAAGGGVGLFAGNATISETSGQTLNTGITTTTGALNLTSTGAGVNVDTAIADTTGAVAINAATDVNINQAVTNLKSGANLSVTAGHDINVAADVDGRSGAAAGGTVNMTAGNNIDVANSIATNNGAVTLTATNGAITVPVGTETLGNPMQWIVSAGNAPVSLTSGSNFSLTSPIDTTGSLHVTSTNGNVTIAAPITDNTGAVTITAGNGLIVNHQVKSADQDIVLNAGAGGITVNTITDFDQDFTSPVNSGNGNLTLNSVGNVSVLDSRGIASAATLTIDTRGQILTGRVGDASTLLARPQSEVLNADGGIVSFGAGFANSVTATSSGGTITLSVDHPDKLRITTGTPNTLDCPTCDINLSSTGDVVPDIGPDVVLNAGGSVNLSPVVGSALTVTARSGDINFSDSILDTVTATAGRDIRVGVDPTDLHTRLWMNQGPATLSAGRNIVVNSPIHFDTVPGNTLTLTAGQNVTMNLLESLGAVHITATNGNVTLNNDIGPHILGLFNPSDLGVASLSISAPSGSATINMQGARAQGNVTISTGGTLDAAKAITSVLGSVSIIAPVQNLHQAVPIGTQAQLPGTSGVSPVVAPGPKQPLPLGPGLASNGASGPAGLVSLGVAPADSIVGGVSAPGAASGSVGLPGTLGAGLPGLSEISVAAADQNLGAVISPGSAGGLVGVAVAGTPGGAGGPGAANGSVSGPGTPSGPATASANAVPDTNAGEDTASALRAAGKSCGENTGKQGDTGLEVVAPGKSSPKPDAANAGCAGGSNATPASAPVNAAPAPAPAPAPILIPPPAPSKGVSSKHR